MAQRIIGTLTSKYGKPNRERQINRAVVPYPRLTWKRPDGIQILLLRTETDMMLMYEHSARNALLEKQNNESQEAERRREMERESRAL